MATAVFTAGVVTGVKLYAFLKDQDPIVLAAAAHPADTASSPTGNISVTPGAFTVMADIVGSTVRVFKMFKTAPTADKSGYYNYTMAPVPVLEYTLTGEDVATFSKGTVFGFGHLDGASGPPLQVLWNAWTFVSQTPGTIKTAPPAIKEPVEIDTPTSEDSDVVVPVNKGTTGGTIWKPGPGPGEGGIVGGVDVDTDGKVTPWVGIKKPGGTTTKVSIGTQYPTGSPTDPLRFKFRKRGRTITIIYGGTPIWQHTLTEDELSGLSTSTKWVGFVDGTGEQVMPPAGSIIIDYDWTANAFRYRLAFPMERYPLGTTRPWSRYWAERPFSFVRRAGVVTVEREPDFDGADQVWVGGHEYVLTADEANVLGDAGFGDYLIEEIV